MQKRPFHFTYVLLFSFITLLFVQACRPEPPQPTATPILTSTTLPTTTSTTLPTTTSTALPTTTSTAWPTPELPPSNLESLTEIRYLGEGGEYTISQGYFIVKRFNPFRFDRVAGSTYQARPNERVWQAMGDMLFKVYEEEHDFKNVWAGCQVRYVQIDDDDDDRRNRWLLNGHEFHVMREGMVVYGSFSITTNGHLTLYAADSIGANIDVACPDPTKTPTATVTHVPPETPIPTETSTPLPPGVTSVPTEIPTTAVTATITPTPTATEPTGPAYTRFNFEVAGHVGRDGFCYMHRDTSEQLLVWQMQDGWVDSAAHPNADSDGWIEVYIPHTSIYVEVFCDAGEGMIRMDIYNGIVHPGNGRIVGWLTRGVKNAIEIGWPDI